MDVVVFEIAYVVAAFSKKDTSISVQKVIFELTLLEKSFVIGNTADSLDVVVEAKLTGFIENFASGWLIFAFGYGNSIINLKSPIINKLLQIKRTQFVPGLELLVTHVIRFLVESGLQIMENLWSVFLEA